MQASVALEITLAIRLPLTRPERIDHRPQQRVAHEEDGNDSKSFGQLLLTLPLFIDEADELERVPGIQPTDRAGAIGRR